MMESESDFRDLEMNMDIIDEYYYGVRIFPGQDPSQIYIGWVTPQFHMYNSTFDMKRIRNVVVCSLDMDNQIKSRFYWMIWILQYLNFNDTQFILLIWC